MRSEEKLSLVTPNTTLDEARPVDLANRENLRSFGSRDQSPQSSKEVDEDALLVDFGDSSLSNESDFGVVDL